MQLPEYAHIFKISFQPAFLHSTLESLCSEPSIPKVKYTFLLTNIGWNIGWKNQYSQKPYS